MGSDMVGGKEGYTTGAALGDFIRVRKKNECIKRGEHIFTDMTHR